MAFGVRRRALRDNLRLNREGRLVDQNSASWNLLTRWIKGLESVRLAV
jgi:hypothetical protein